MSAVAREITYALESHPNAPHSDQYSAQLISEVTKFLDVFATSKDDKVLVFNFYGMNQSQCSPSDDDDQLSTFREFLDRTQYTEDNVVIYEWIFGQNFISPGGIDENRRVLNTLKSFNQEFGVHVLGCDLSSNMILHAFERNQRDKDHRVEFRIADAMVYKYEPNSFDVVYSRDCIQHIKDINVLFKNIYDWLKPEEFRQLAEDAGFTNIFTENMTPRFREILMEERQKAIDNKEEFVQKFGKHHFDKLIHSWEDKMQFIKMTTITGCF
uniref:phosphoethanolamine N-methyltransferase n=1 Tax=Ditylenchus dipsaci TaxID=166011 RepID=A0A915D0X5_9BILA